MKQHWPKAITVDKRIVKILSESTYENFPNSIKEIICNSYDADASRVDVTFDVANETITFEDNGHGMNEEEFALYLKIAGTKEKRRKATLSGRKIVGQFGVGFLSVFPFFKNYSVESTKLGSPEILSASIACYQYFTKDGTRDIGDIKVQGSTRIDRNSISKKYTRIKVTGFTALCKAFFFPQQKVNYRLFSVQNHDGLERLKWHLMEDLPLLYEESSFNKYFYECSPNLPFEVYINGEALLRPVYGKELLEEGREQIGTLNFTYFISTNRESIRPNEGKALKIRNLNVGVGDRTTFGLGTEVGGARSRLHWLTGEIHLLEGLNELIKVSRDDFNYSPDFEELKEYFRKKLAHYSTKLEIDAKIKGIREGSGRNSRISNLSMLRKLGISKSIDLEDKSYEITIEKWNYKKDPFPACKLVDGGLIINSRYPLFRGVKYTDIFIRLHLMLLVNLEKGIIKPRTYTSLLTQIEEYYQGYIK